MGSEVLKSDDRMITLDLETLHFYNALYEDLNSGEPDLCEQAKEWIRMVMNDEEKNFFWGWCEHQNNNNIQGIDG